MPPADTPSKRMLTCRTIGHMWFPSDATRKPRFGFLLVLRCERCDTVREDLVDRTGFLLNRNYVYPEGYRDVDTMGTRADRRAWLVHEVMAPPEPPIKLVRGRTA